MIASTKPTSFAGHGASSGYPRGRSLEVHLAGEVEVVPLRGQAAAVEHAIAQARR